jgi:hypothetical protein
LAQVERGRPYGQTTAYLPAIDLLKAWFQIEGHDGARRVCEKVTGKLLTVDVALQPTISPFLALLDVPAEDPPWQALDPPPRRQRTLDAVKRVLVWESPRHPLLLILEDLHWIDGETQPSSMPCSAACRRPASCSSSPTAMRQAFLNWHIPLRIAPSGP